ncbi:hypothetical protein K501DRAFT_287013 [Backusella circina FSU 941]|nr:hypothetical protein K501DRAFT_287013 [Backusella circina FSU 941]
MARPTRRWKEQRATTRRISLERDIKREGNVKTRGKPKRTFGNSLNTEKGINNSKISIHEIVCKKCRITFTTVKEKIAHNRIHQSPKKLNIRGPNGDFVTFLLSVSDDGLYACPHCPLHYVTLNGARNHLLKLLRSFTLEQIGDMKKARDIPPVVRDNTEHVEDTGTHIEDQSTDNVIAERQQMVHLTSPKIHCKRCLSSFDDKNLLKTHNYVFHKSKYFLVAESNLDELFHFIISRNHSYVNCPLCNSKSQSISVLDHHLRTRHELSVWITRKQSRDHDSVLSNEEQHQDTSYLYEPALTVAIPKQESSLWKSIKSLFWS